SYRYASSRRSHTSLVIDDSRGDAWSSSRDGQWERLGCRACMDARVARIGCSDPVCSGVPMAGGVKDEAIGLVGTAGLEDTAIGTEATGRVGEEGYIAYRARCARRSGVCNYCCTFG